ncbi:hypothetical protein [Streptosporangium sp. V21-05]|uniref:hypothetical protein n=1 Tax=Streptosporangium sp. V21-05 TaxID=3446115 RepID=UPI003F52D14A
MFEEPAERCQSLVAHRPRCWHGTQDIDESIAIYFLKGPRDGLDRRRIQPLRGVGQRVRFVGGPFEDVGVDGAEVGWEVQAVIM